MKTLCTLLATALLAVCASAGKCHPGPEPCRACRDCSRCKYCNAVKPGSGCSVARAIDKARWRAEKAKKTR